MPACSEEIFDGMTDWHEKATVLELLRSKDGATIVEIAKAKSEVNERT